MRQLAVQFLTPPLLMLAGGALGLLAGQPAVGLLLGAAVALPLAGLAAGHARRRLAALSTPTRATLDGAEHDEIDVALRFVARQFATATHLNDALTRQLERQTALLDRMHDGVLRVGDDGRVRYANVAAGALLGGRNPTGQAFIRVTRDHELRQALVGCLRTGDARQHTFVPTGDARAISAVIVRLSADPPEALVMLRDITEVNRLQQLRRDFVANVSHELRTPLSTMKILTETLLDLRDDDPEALRFLTKLDAEIDEMTRLVRDLLDLARLEAHSAELSLQPMDARRLVAEVRERMLPVAARHGVRLTADGDEAPLPLIADERRLQQALVNLARNAIDHTPNGGSVIIRAEPREGAVAFTVRDTGVGIRAGDLPRIWERFYKADRARSEGGTGLGLAIVKHIVQAHDGAVSATSALGVGSTFSMTIPTRQR